METQQLQEELQRLLGSSFIVKDIRHVNHKPHPFTIGAPIVAWTADNHGGMLTEAAIESFEKQRGSVCAVPGCTFLYKEHTNGDKVLFLQLTENLDNKTAANTIFKIKELMLQEKVDGICFVETPEQYRILPPKTDEDGTG